MSDEQNGRWETGGPLAGLPGEKPKSGKVKSSWKQHAPPLELDTDIVKRLGTDGVLWAQEMEKYGVGRADNLLPWACNMLVSAETTGFSRGVETGTKQLEASVRPAMEAAWEEGFAEGKEEGWKRDYVAKTRQVYIPYKPPYSWANAPSTGSLGVNHVPKGTERKLTDTEWEQRKKALDEAYSEGRDVGQKIEAMKNDYANRTFHGNESLQKTIADIQTWTEMEAGRIKPEATRQVNVPRTDGINPLTANPYDRARTAWETAGAIVQGDRRETHGDFRQNFEAIAVLWDAYMKASAATHPVLQIRAEDVAHMMVLMKIARTMGGKVNPDDYVDAIGYATIAAGLRPADKVEI